MTAKDILVHKILTSSKTGQEEVVVYLAQLIFRKLILMPHREKHRQMQLAAVEHQMLHQEIHAQITDILERMNETVTLTIVKTRFATNALMNTKDAIHVKKLSE